jgi:activator of HSP90 ATPase
VTKPGGRFAQWDGSLERFVVYLEKDRRIFLTGSATGWPEGHYSIADVLLSKVKGGTRIEFPQFGIPASDFADISDGWRQYYWEPLRTYFG